MTKFHLAKLLKEKNFDEIVKDIERNPLGFGLDGKINLKDEKDITRTLKKLGITKDYVVMWGSGNVYREFLYVDDLADACIFLMENYDYKDIGELINIGTGEDITLINIARMVKVIVGFDGEIKHDLTKPDGTPRKLLDVSRLFKLGWRPKVSLEEGIKRSYEAYKKVSRYLVK
jgi:GDP-L-fucose synthase